MSTYAVVVDDIVSNVIIWDGETPLELELLVELTEDLGVGIGWSYIDGQFVEPIIIPILEESENSPETPNLEGTP
jgi:hypothetical protein